jgi:hypothetical protein
MFRVMTRRALLTAATAAIIGGVGASSALATTAVSVGPSADLLNRVVAQVPVTVSCGPFPGPFNFSVSVTVTEAVAKQIAQGTAFAGVNTNGAPLALTCDGTPQSIVMNVPANPSGPPFKKGKGVVSASAAGGSFPTFEQASAGPQAIQLR